MRKPRIINYFIISILFWSAACFGEDANTAADSAVAVILFEYDGSEEFASYVVKDDGFVDINFARNMPDELYAEILTKMKNHPHIKDVLAGKTGPMCRF